MTTDGLKHLEYMRRCQELADRATGPDRQALLQMAKTFKRGAIQIEKSAEQLAESRELLKAVDRLLRLDGSAKKVNPEQ